LNYLPRVGFEPQLSCSLASPVARVTGASHQHPACPNDLRANSWAVLLGILYLQTKTLRSRKGQQLALGHTALNPLGVCKCYVCPICTQVDWTWIVEI
jgi:hypothetical protein